MCNLKLLLTNQILSARLNETMIHYILVSVGLLIRLISRVIIYSKYWALMIQIWC